MNDAMTLASMTTQQQHTRQNDASAATVGRTRRRRGGDLCYKQRRNFDAGVIFFFFFPQTRCVEERDDLRHCSRRVREGEKCIEWWRRRWGGKDILVPGTPSREGFLRGCVRNEKNENSGITEIETLNKEEARWSTATAKSILVQLSRGIFGVLPLAIPDIKIPRDKLFLSLMSKIPTSLVRLHCRFYEFAHSTKSTLFFKHS